MQNLLPKDPGLNTEQAQQPQQFSCLSCSAHRLRFVCPTVTYLTFLRQRRWGDSPPPVPWEAGDLWLVSGADSAQPLPRTLSKVLKCFSCFLVVFQSDFCSLTHLVKLDLSKNRLQQLPVDFGRLVSLQHLDLLNNRLVTLPVSFAQLKVKPAAGRLRKALGRSPGSCDPSQVDFSGEASILTILLPKFSCLCATAQRKFSHAH